MLALAGKKAALSIIQPVQQLSMQSVSIEVPRGYQFYLKEECHFERAPHAFRASSPGCESTLLVATMSFRQVVVKQGVWNRGFEGLGQ